MPRREVDPLIKTLRAFEEASLDKAIFAGELVQEILKRRQHTERPTVAKVRAKRKDRTAVEHLLNQG